MNHARPFSAAAAILAAMLLIGLIDNFVVRIAEDGGLWQFHALRSAMALPLIAALALFGLGVLRPKRVGWVMLRSSVVALALVLYFGALGFLSVAEAAAGLFTAPLFVLVISAVALGERVGPVRAAAACGGFAGVLLVLRPETGGLSSATVMAVLAGFFYAIGAILTRRRCAEEPPLALLAGFFAVLGVVGLAGLAATALWPPSEAAQSFLSRPWASPTPAFLWWTFVQAVGSVAAVLLIVRGYQLADASFVSVFEYSLLIFAAAWAYLLRGELIDGSSLAGICLIIGSAVLIALRERVRMRAAQA